jgi:hypothetical protein
MTLFINCIFGDGPQTLIKVNATDADVAAIEAAMSGDPGDVLRVVCRTTSQGKDHERLIRAGAIRSVDVER